jgi:hypothetical protein
MMRKQPEIGWSTHQEDACRASRARVREGAKEKDEAVRKVIEVYKTIDP